MAKKGPYQLTIDLNVLQHLGLNLYSNIPAVISEVVANSWDADADNVEIGIDEEKETITLTDDGWGMSEAEINDRYLKVGYDKRKEEPVVTPKNRHIMGRKGIGKLSLFSIANEIEIHSVKLDNSENAVEKNAFIMKAEDIQAAIESEDDDSTYYPDPIDVENVKLEKGTRITLRDLKKGVATTEIYLRKRLARRFSVIGSKHNFHVSVNGKAISIEDRDYFPKIEYLWVIGEGGEEYIDYCSNHKNVETLDGVVNKENGYRVSGWIGTFDEQKSIEEGNNSIVILAWGKLVHEDILVDMKEGGLFTKYLIGEVRADFLDLDDLEDIMTSDRQRLKENDPRYQQLRDYIQKTVLKEIQRNWRDWRNENAEEKALENPTVKEWFDQLGPDNKKYARILFGKIESFPIENAAYKKELYRHGILAFETLALQNSLSTLEKIESDEDFSLLADSIGTIDQLESAHYYQIAKGRVAVLKKLQDIALKAKERVIQEHIFDHLWLLDQSWDRASTDRWMEERVTSAFEKLDAQLTEEEREGRIDIRYMTAVGKHIIVELKKYDVTIAATELVKQVRKYRSALIKVLEQAKVERPLVEIVCVLGDDPTPKDEVDENEKMLASVNARHITYDKLIMDARSRYREYLETEEKIGRIQKLLAEL